MGGTAGFGQRVFSTSDGTAASGSNYLGVTNTLTFPATGKPSRTSIFPSSATISWTSTRTVNLALSNVVGASLGGQPTALLTIINNDNSGVSFSSPISPSSRTPSMAAGPHPPAQWKFHRAGLG